jgi:hypothetical protein
MALLRDLKNWHQSQPQAAELAGKHISGYRWQSAWRSLSCASADRQPLSTAQAFLRQAPAAKNCSSQKGDDTHGQLIFEQ